MRKNDLQEAPAPCKVIGCDREARHKKKQLCDKHFRLEYYASNPDKALSLYRNRTRGGKRNEAERRNAYAKDIAAVKQHHAAMLKRFDM
jgi:hypothetical protein